MVERLSDTNEGQLVQPSGLQLRKLPLGELTGHKKGHQSSNCKASLWFHSPTHSLGERKGKIIMRFVSVIFEFVTGFLYDMALDTHSDFFFRDRVSQ